MSGRTMSRDAIVGKRRIPESVSAYIELFMFGGFAEGGVGFFGGAGAAIGQAYA
jgi:hypothetical protein